MKLPEPDADDTIRIAPRPRARSSRTPIVVAAAVAALLVAGGSGWLLLRRPSVVAPPPTAPIAALTSPAIQAPAAPAAEPSPAPQSPEPAPAFQIETANEDQILRHVATGLTLFRFAGNPQILVLDFASLHEQGMMLNRVAALIEKEKLPRDRVLNDTELDGAIRASGDTVDTYYYGHDYSAAALAGSFRWQSGTTLHSIPKRNVFMPCFSRWAGWNRGVRRADLHSGGRVRSAHHPGRAWCNPAA